MIFLNNNSSAGSWSGRHIQFSGSISGSNLRRRDHESDNFLLGCIVGSFGIAITLALILLPLSICCSTVIYHPFYIFGLVMFILLTLFGGILCVCYPIMIKCWRYRESKAANATQRKTSASKIYSPYVEDAASASFNDLENQPDISPAAGNTGLPSHQVAFLDEKDRS